MPPLTIDKGKRLYFVNFEVTLNFKSKHRTFLKQRPQSLQFVLVTLFIANITSRVYLYLEIAIFTSFGNVISLHQVPSQKEKD